MAHKIIMKIPHDRKQSYFINAKIVTESPVYPVSEWELGLELSTDSYF